MPVIVCLVLSLSAQTAPPALLDVSALTIGPPATVVEIDTGKLKGEPRRLSWSPDGAMLYLQTAEGNPPEEKVHHYTIPLDGRRVVAVDAEPDWAVAFWSVKQDRVAPGLPGLAIEVQQKAETLKGMAPAGALDRTGSPESAAGTLSPDAGHGNQKVQVVRLTLLGQEIGVWQNERVIPGTRFTWGPSGSGALAFVGDGGRLVFFDREKRKREIPGVKEALLPAWSTDGGRLAFLVKTARKKYTVSWVSVAR